MRRSGWRLNPAPTWRNPVPITIQQSGKVMPIALPHAECRQRLLIVSLSPDPAPLAGAGLGGGLPLPFDPDLDARPSLSHAFRSHFTPARSRIGRKRSARPAVRARPSGPGPAGWAVRAVQFPYSLIELASRVDSEE